MQMRSVPIGKRFTLDGVGYTRVPDMVIEGWGCSFIINCVRVADTDKDIGCDVPLTIIADYILDDTEVVIYPLSLHEREERKEIGKKVVDETYAKWETGLD